MTSIREGTIKCMYEFLKTVCANIENATPEAIAALPEVAKILIRDGSHYSG